jgi:hypothetical protein
MRIKNIGYPSEFGTFTEIFQAENRGPKGTLSFQRRKVKKNSPDCPFRIKSGKEKENIGGIFYFCRASSTTI